MSDNNKKKKRNGPVDTWRKLNVHKTFRRRPGRLLNVLYTFNLRPVSAGLGVSNVFLEFHLYFIQSILKSSEGEG